MVTKKILKKTIYDLKTKKSIGTSVKIYNYFSETEFYPDKYITGLFAARGNWNRISKSELKSTDKPIHFIYINGKYLLQKYYYGVKATIGSMIDDSRKIVSLKHNLVDYLGKHPMGRKYIMESHTINAEKIMKRPNMLYKYNYLFDSNDSTLSFNPISPHKPKQPVLSKIYIFKPVSGFAGSNIEMIMTFDELKNTLTKIISKYRNTWARGSSYNKEWVLQEYLADPLLFKDKDANYKFHIRHYYIFRHGPKPSFYLKKGLIATGLKPYIKGDWQNKDIHDTHFHGHDGRLFPSELNLTAQQTTQIYKQITELYKIIDNYLKKHAKCYKEYKYCFEIFGADLMITNDYKIKILELNDSPGLGYEDREDIQDEKKSVIENVLSIIIDDYFPPAKPVNNPFSKDVVFLK